MNVARHARFVVALAPCLVAIACGLPAEEEAFETDEAAIALKDAGAADGDADACVDSGVAKVTADTCVPKYVWNGRYYILDHNCHHAAQEFMDTNGGGVVACHPSASHGDASPNVPDAGHTINYLVEGDQVCLYEPQSPLTPPCCFPAAKDACGKVIVPPTLPPGSSAVAMCIKRLCAQSNDGGLLTPDAGGPICLPPGSPSSADDTTECQQAFPKSRAQCETCCDARASYWQTNCPGAPTTPDAFDQAFYRNRCKSECR